MGELARGSRARLLSVSRIKLQFRGLLFSRVQLQLFGVDKTPVGPTLKGAFSAKRSLSRGETLEEQQVSRLGAGPKQQAGVKHTRRSST